MAFIKTETQYLQSPAVEINIFRLVPRRRPPARLVMDQFHRNDGFLTKSCNEPANIFHNLVSIVSFALFKAIFILKLREFFI